MFYFSFCCTSTQKVPNYCSVYVLNGGKTLLPHEFAEGIGRLLLYCIPYTHEKIEYNNSMYWKYIA